MFNTLNLANLRNGEFYQFLFDVNGIINLNDPAALKIEKLYGQQTVLTEAIGGLFSADRGSPITDEITALDGRRDQAIIGIGLYIDSFTHHFDEATRQYATLLQDNLALYGSSIARQSLPSETASLTKIVNDWTVKPAFAAAVAALQLTPWLTELDMANRAFNEKYLARAQEDGDEPVGNLKEKRAEAVKVWYKLRNLIESKYNIAEDEGSGSEPYKKLINSLNAIIDKYNLLLASRGGRNGGNGDAVAKP